MLSSDITRDTDYSIPDPSFLSTRLLPQVVLKNP